MQASLRPLPLNAAMEAPMSALRLANEGTPIWKEPNKRKPNKKNAGLSNMWNYSPAERIEELQLQSIG